MRILTLVWSIGLGGTERAAVNYAVAYQNAALQSSVLVLGEGLDRKEDLLLNNVKVWSLVENPGLEEQIIAEVKEWKPDIIQIHNFSVGLYHYILRIKSNDCKIVHTNVFSSPYYSKEYAIVDASLQLTHWGLWRFQKAMSLEKYIPICKVVPYICFPNNFIQPADLEIESFKRQYNIPATSFVVGRIGQPLMSKWDSKIITVAERIIATSTDIYFVFVGLPKELLLMLNTKEKSIRDRIIVIEKISGDKDLSIFYYALNVFAHISKIGESFGYVLTEAMTCEVPVVTMLTPFKDNGQYEVVGHGRGGLCVSNVDQFCEALMNVYMENKRSVNSYTHLRAWVQSRFSPEVVVPDLILFYQKLIKNSPLNEAYDVGRIKETMRLYKFSSLYFLMVSWRNAPLFQKAIHLIKKF